MKALGLVAMFQFFPLLLLPLLQTVSTISPTKIPRLSPFDKEALNVRTADDESLMSSSSSQNSKDYKTYYYRQTLDHFNYAPQSYATFRQRYVVSSNHWGGATSSSPIFAYLGEEAPLDGDLTVIGFLRDNAPYFNSLSVYIEVKLLFLHIIYILE